MSPLTKHITIPAIAPLLLLGLNFLPVNSRSACVARGLAALAIVFISLGVGIAAGAAGLRARGRGEPDFRKWAVTAFILVLPALLLLRLA